MVVVVSGGGALIAPSLVNLGFVGSSALISEGALALAGTSTVFEGAALTTAIAAENLVIALTGLTVPNLWNPLGWAIGGVLVGAASQSTSQVVSWDCYKPIIGEVETEGTSSEPITFATLAAHPEVRRVFVFASAASANLPDVEVENSAGQCYLLRGVVLPWAWLRIMQSQSRNRSGFIPLWAISRGL